MEVLYFLQSIRNGVLDFLFSVITLLGEETVFMVIGMIIFWCVNKYKGYFILMVGFAGTVLNQFLKIVCRVPRPWVQDPNFTIVESAREAATGYSFPSGHTQTSVGLFGGITMITKNKLIRIVSIVMCFMVPLSRMYLGVHTPADVLVSCAIAVGLLFAARPVFIKREPSQKTMYSVLIGLTVLMVSYLLFVCLYQFPQEVYNAENIHNLISAQKNGFSLLGCLVGMIAVYTVDIKHTKFDTRAVWWAQIIKVAGGLLLMLAAKELLRFPLDAILDANTWARFIRYFLMAIVGGVLWPMTFKYFPKNNKSEVK